MDRLIAAFIARFLLKRFRHWFHRKHPEFDEEVEDRMKKKEEEE